MKTLKLASVATALVLSMSANAAVITYGYLVTDDTTDFITDATTGREYKRFDAFDLTYAQTAAAVGAGGLYEGWSIATSDIADEFYSAALGVLSTPCSGPTDYGTTCGQIAGWTDGDFGASWVNNNDIFWYLSTNDTQNVDPSPLGTSSIREGGEVRDWDDSSDFTRFDIYQGTENPVNALLYREVSTVPVPAAAWLFGSGLLGLAGVARRKKV